MRYLCRPGGPFNANTYLISNDFGALLIVDPTDAAYIRSFIEHGNHKPLAVLLTHGHYDHFCALNELLEHYNIPVYIHSADIEMLNDAHKNCMDLIYYDLPQVSFDHEVKPLRDGDELCFDGFSAPIKVFHAPGHSKGCVCYLFNEDKPTLFTGDVLFAGSIGRTDLYGSSSIEMRESLRRLAQLPNDLIICPGHGPSTDIGSEKKSNPYFMY